jgi:DNA-binding beta-propeller fold protein YncE
VDNIPERRRFLTRTLVTGTATFFAPTILAGYEAAEKLLGDANLGDTTLPGVNIPDVEIPDIEALLATLDLQEGFYIADPKTGALYKLDQEAHTVSRLNSDLTEVWTYGGLGEDAGQLNFPTSVAPAADGGVYVVDSGNARIVHVDATGARTGDIGGDGRFSSVRAAVVDADGVVWVADPGAHVVKGFNAAGEELRSFGALGEGAAELNAPRGLALDADGRLHVVDTGNARIQVFDRDGTHVRSYGGYGLEDGRHVMPRSVAIAPSGFTYVADPVGGAVQVFDNAGQAVARLDNLSVAGKSAVPLDVSISAGGLVQVRLHAWTAET